MKHVGFVREKFESFDVFTKRNSCMNLPNHQPRAEYDTMPTLKRSIAVFIFRVFFAETAYNKNEYVLLFTPKCWGDDIDLYVFQGRNKVNIKKYRPGFELGSSISFLTIIKQLKDVLKLNKHFETTPISSA